MNPEEDYKSRQNCGHEGPSPRSHLADPKVVAAVAESRAAYDKGKTLTLDQAFPNPPDTRGKQVRQGELTALLAVLLEVVLFLCIGWQVHIENDRIREESHETIQDVLYKSLAVKPAVEIYDCTRLR